MYPSCRSILISAYSFSFVVTLQWVYTISNHCWFMISSLTWPYIHLYYSTSILVPYMPSLPFFTESYRCSWFHQCHGHITIHIYLYQYQYIHPAILWLCNGLHWFILVLIQDFITAMAIYPFLLIYINISIFIYFVTLQWVYIDSYRCWFMILSMPWHWANIQVFEMLGLGLQTFHFYLKPNHDSWLFLFLLT